MIKKLREYKIDISLKSAFVIMAIVFLGTFLVSKWIANGSETIEDVMVLHHEDNKMTSQQKEYHYLVISNRHKLLYHDISLPMPGTSYGK